MSLGFSIMVRIDDSKDEVRCWLSRDELETIEQAAGRKGWQREIAMQLMGRCGFRASEVPFPGDRELRYSDEGELWLVEVRGKNTSGGGKKTRDARVPDDVQDNIRRYSRERDLQPGESWVDVSTPSVRRWVKEAAQTVAERRESDRWLNVSSHDLRRSWATYHLVERDVDVRTMMAVGGWSDYSAIEPYLAQPTEQRIGDAFS